MVPLTLNEIAEACGGRIRSAAPDAIVSGVGIDSRAVVPGELFVALRGERTDGHRYAADAIGRGAVAALVAEEMPVPSVVVASTQDALAAIAEAARSRIGAQVVAITGSSGKTSTKALIAAACATTRRTVAAAASYNNEIGVPLTVLAADPETEVLVVEVGSRRVGHIAALMPIVQPTVAVITNVGSAHVGMFGSIEQTARAKGELVEALDADGVAVLNADDAIVRRMASRTKAEVVTYGRSADADVRAEDVRLDADARASFTVVAGGARVPVHLSVPGEHMVHNALAAVAAAIAVGVGAADAAEGVGSAAAVPGRMQVVNLPSGRRILDDSYNANPESMAAALRTLVVMGRGRPTWAVLGHMAELGESATAEHDRIGRMAVRLGVGSLVTVGPESRAIHEAARLEGMFGGEAIFVADADEAIALLRDRLEHDAVVLVKASRAVGLERVARALEEDA